MRRMLRIDWRTWLAFSFAVLVIFVVTDRARVADAYEREVARGQHDRQAAAVQRDELIEGQRKLRAEIQQAAIEREALLAYLRDQGIDVPPTLLRGGGTTIVERDSDDNDDDSDDSTSRRPSAQPTTRPTTRPPFRPPTTEAPRRIEVPDVPVPLPDEAGKATDDVKKNVEDTVNNLLP